MVCNSLNGLDFMPLGEVHKLSVWIIEASPSSNLYLTDKFFPLIRDKDLVEIQNYLSLLYYNSWAV